jgi:hypothetical protein
MPSLPVQNNVVSVSANGNYCTIIPTGSIISGGTGKTPSAQNSTTAIDLATYYIAGGSTGVGTVVTFQTLGGDGTWRAMVSPAPITIANSTNYNGIINGPVNGLRIVVSGIVGNGLAFAELIGSVRSM